MKKLLFGILSLSLIVQSSSVDAQSASVRKYDAMLQMINFAYVDSVNDEQLTEEAIRALLKTLDPHSVYIPAKELREMNEPLVGNFEGVGIQFNIMEDTILVTQTIPGGPSEKLGIRAGDRIVKIDTAVVAGVKITNADVMKKLRGTKGTKVTVMINRRGEPELLEYVITRDKIPLFSMDASYMVSPETGYIKISRFADSTVDEFKEALARLKKEGMQSLILDLSGNGGGYLNRAVELADEFLDDKKMVVYTEGRTSPRQEYKSSSVGGFEKGKLVILIDEASASASEIVSGAVQDWDRGLIIGRRSFAKGLVQKPFPLPDGSAVRLTVARYYTPSGRCIQKPYEKGDEYESDFTIRANRGELYHADSIKFIDSLRFETAAKRSVYGGGGIMPDVFVPLDTSYFSKYLSDLQRKNVIFEFALNYTDRNRKSLVADYPDVTTFRSKFKVDQKFIDEFIAFADGKGVAFDSAGYNTSKDRIHILLRANVARDLWNTAAFWQVFNEANPFVVKALASLRDDTFEKMKIAVR